VDRAVGDAIEEAAVITERLRFGPMTSPKDVGEYFDHVERMWHGYGCTAEPLGPQGAIFEYETHEGKETGRGHLLARISLPGHPEAYLHVEDWLVPRRGHIERESYAYDLIFQGARLENWHYHHGQYHRHDADGTRRPAPRITLEDAIRRSLEVLERGYLPD
jgi:hypothetical protein